MFLIRRGLIRLPALLLALPLLAFVFLGAAKPVGAAGGATPAGVADPGGARTGNANDVVRGDGVALTDTPAWREGSGEPLARELANTVGQNRIAINVVFTLLAAFMVMFMQAGFALLECGFCRSKNAVHVCMTNFLVYPISILGFWAVGFGLMFGSMSATPSSLGGMAPLKGDDFFGLWGTQGFFLPNRFYDVGVFTMFVFQAVFMDTMTTIPTGALAERWRLPAFLAYCLFASMIIYPVYGHWVWGGGILADLGARGLGHGAVDFAGSGVVHMVGGFTGLVGAILLGPRKDRFDKQRDREFLPHNYPMAIFGAFILAFGWFAFNAGSALGASGEQNLRIGVIAANTMLASAAGAVSALLYCLFLSRSRSIDPGLCVNGMLGGLVAITAPCAYVNAAHSVAIGIIAGFLVPWITALLVRARIDDPVGAFPVHGICGLWGVVSVGIFADGTFGVGLNGVGKTTYLGNPGQGVSGLLIGDTGQLAAQLVSAVACIAWATAASLLFFGAQKLLGRLRSLPEHEDLGLDVHELQVEAYRA